MTSPPEYKVDDRSILLPYYRRYLVDPLLPLIPRSLHPNWITHAGHLLNLAAAMLLIGVWPKAGWAFIASTLLLQLYVWCDNADGAHARATRQCSPMGEYLDHGLDILNTVYIAYLTAMSLGAPPVWWVVIVLVIPGAAGVVMWEQATTGVYRLGLMNQIESCLVLSAALLLSGVFGQDFFVRTTIFGLELRLVMILWCMATILFGVVRGMGRVAQHGIAKLSPVLALIAFAGLLAWSVTLGAIPTVAAVVIATGANVAFAARMLASRLHTRIPRTMPTLLGGILAIGSTIVLHLLNGETSPGLGTTLAAAACVVFGAQTILDARDGLQRLGDEQAARAA